MPAPLSAPFEKTLVTLKHLDKIYSPIDKIKKAEIIEYYSLMYPLILPHIKNKPFSMIHFPNGIDGDFFYQKECPKDAPSWLKTVELPSSSRGSIKWCLVNTRDSILYMANRSVIEMHTWFSRLPDLNKADMAVIDLDPSGKTGFQEAVVIAKAFGLLLQKMQIYAIPMTSGGSGIHIRIPIKTMTFPEIQNFLIKLCRIIVEVYPNLATLERVINKRGDRVYLDAIQNAAGKTIIAPYSLRAKPKLPVSTPLLWEELEDENLKAENFTIHNVLARYQKYGDLFENFYKKKQKLPNL